MSVWVFLAEKCTAPLPTEFVLNKLFQAVQIVCLFLVFTSLSHVYHRARMFCTHEVESQLFVHFLLLLLLITVNPKIILFLLLLSSLLFINLSHHFHVKILLIHEFINMVLSKVVPEELIINSCAHQNYS